MSVVNVTTLNELNNVIAQNKVVIIDFTATWCPPCKMIAPIAQSLAKAKGVVMVKVDVDKGQQVANKFKVSGIPAFFLMQDNSGNILDTFTGANKEKLQQMFAIAASLL